MSIVAGDLKLKYSVKTGAAGNSTAGTAAGSLGKYISTTEITTAVANNLFDDVSGSENAASDVEYRCIFIHNSHATITAENTKVYLSAEVADGAVLALAVDGVAASAIGAAPAQADEVANENTAPTGEAFSAPTTEGAALSIGNLAPGECRAIWVRRTAANTGAVANDGGTLRFVCESV